ncbi:MAG: hypothetical protein LBS91_06160 [Clostridiales Family XIII bacterium]|jgi:hypothetical protein|nr:hypothetical protein [Clostridiales Family XIII bacterium]
MKTRLLSLKYRYFGEDAPLDVQTFHLLGLAGMAAGACVALSSLFTQAGAPSVALNLAASALAFVLLRYTRKTGRYRQSYRIVVAAVFLAAFPVLFFTAGGYRSGMPCFFVFALVFTALMLPGKERAAALIAEFAIYAACCAAAYLRPETVTPFASERGYVIDVLTGIVASSVLLLLVILLYIRI